MYEGIPAVTVVNAKPSHDPKQVTLSARVVNEGPFTLLINILNCCVHPTLSVIST